MEYFRYKFRCKGEERVRSVPGVLALFEFMGRHLASGGMFLALEKCPPVQLGKGVSLVQVSGTKVRSVPGVPALFEFPGRLLASGVVPGTGGMSPMYIYSGVTGKGVSLVQVPMQG